MTTFLLGIDAGGTKTKARLEEPETGQVWQLRDGPASLTNDRSGAIKRIFNIINELLDKADVAASQVHMVCGIAGANHEVARLKLVDKVAEIGLASYEITRDSIISVYGAGHGKPLLCVAVGTGTVAVSLNDQGEAKQFAGWGFIAGDKGSGADLGRKLVRGALDHFDADDYLDDPLYRALFDELGQTHEDVMAWIHAAKPTDYARLMHIMQRFPEHARVKELLAYAGKVTSRLIETGLAYNKVPVSLLGGMASYIADDIDPELKALLVTPKGDALDGAIWLAARNQKDLQTD